MNVNIVHPSCVRWRIHRLDNISFKRELSGDCVLAKAMALAVVNDSNALMC